jgi:spore coat protein CotH
VIAVALAIGLLDPPAPALAQTADDLFTDGTLHEIRLFINSRDLRNLRTRFQENTYYTADFLWRNIRVRNVGVRSRGGIGSRNGSKLGLRVDFNRYTTGQEFLGLRSLVLDNGWQDGSFLHERLAMAVFTRLGYPAPRESYCRLFINNEYQGLYSIVESIDNTFLSRTLGENTGYLFSYEQRPGFRAEFLGDDLAPYKAMFEAQNHERDADATLYVPIRNLFREINQDVDAVWRDRVGELIDLEQFVAHVAVENAVVETDGILGLFGMNNFFLYRYAGTNRHRLLPWDKDNALGGPETPIFDRADTNELFLRAITFPELRDVYLNTLESAAKLMAQDGWLESEIDRAAPIIADAVREDTRKQFTTDQFFESLVSLREFAQQRPAFLLRAVERARQQ